MTVLLIASVTIKCSINILFYSTSSRMENVKLTNDFILTRLIPQLVSLISKQQYISYVQLIKDRDKALKQALSGVGTLANDNEQPKWKANWQNVDRLLGIHHPKGPTAQACSAKEADTARHPLKDVTNQSRANKLENHHPKPRQTRTNQLRHIYEIYLKLRQTIRLTNRSFGVRNLIFILYHFVTVVEMSYVACMIWVR